MSDKKEEEHVGKNKEESQVEEVRVLKSADGSPAVLPPTATAKVKPGIEFVKLPKSPLHDFDGWVDEETLLLANKPHPDGIGISFKITAKIRTLDLTNNKISEIRNLDQMPNLETLNLRHNLITNLSGLEVCPSLTEIDLYENSIKRIENLINLPNLR
jgi:hypothetical protein